MPRRMCSALAYALLVLPVLVAVALPGVGHLCAAGTEDSWFGSMSFLILGALVVAGTGLLAWVTFSSAPVENEAREDRPSSPV